MGSHRIMSSDHASNLQSKIRKKEYTTMGDNLCGFIFNSFILKLLIQLTCRTTATYSLNIFSFTFYHIIILSLTLSLSHTLAICSRSVSPSLFPIKFYFSNFSFRLFYFPYYSVAGLPLSPSVYLQLMIIHYSITRFVISVYLYIQG